jgi:hypothetical protein
MQEDARTPYTSSKTNSKAGNSRAGPQKGVTNGSPTKAEGGGARHRVEGVREGKDGAAASEATEGQAHVPSAAAASASPLLSQATELSVADQLGSFELDLKHEHAPGEKRKEQRGLRE